MSTLTTCLDKHDIGLHGVSQKFYGVNVKT